MLKNVQKTPPSIFFEGEIWDTLLPYFGLHLKSLFSEKKLPLFNSQQSYSKRCSKNFFKNTISTPSTAKLWY